MALYKPCGTWENVVDTCRIPRFEDRDGVTCYIIEICILPYKWHVAHRYRHFVELHEKMTKLYAISKKLLPPKKLLGSRSENFILERQKALELYLQKLLHQCGLLQEPLAMFLDFQKYEIRTMTAILAEKLFINGEEILKEANPYEFSLLHLHCITERLKLGGPTCYFNNANQDIAHLVEFMMQLKYLKILGSFQHFEDSNIIPNELSFDLSMFKVIETLEVVNCKLENNLTSVDTLRSKLKSIRIKESLTDLSSLLLCEILHWCPVMDRMQNWPFWNWVTDADFSHNSLTKINSCIKLLSSVKRINLSYNGIQVIENMETLSELTTLILSHNKIQDIESLHTRLGNIHSLNLSFNKIRYLHGLSKLFSVSELFLESNLVSSMVEVAHLSRLPCLETLNLMDNPVAFTVDYSRPELMLLFGSCPPEITLDGMKPTEKEIDTVSVLQALKQARGEPISALKHDVSEVARILVPMPNPILSFSTTHSQNKQCSGECSHHKITRDGKLQDPSEFRQHVESLRRIGGSDWLRLLNEMHSPSKEVLDEQIPKSNDRSNSNTNNVQFHVHSSEKISGLLTSQSIKTSSFSLEISYPEWLMFLDSNNQDFKQQLFSTCLQYQSNLGKISSAMVTEAKILWIVMLEKKECSLFEIPVCALILQTEIMFLQLKNFTTSELPEEISFFPQLYPEFSYMRSIVPSDILSVSLGPCNAYVEIKVKTHTNTENVTILLTNKDTASKFATECHRLYKIEFLHKLNPFINNFLDMENITENEFLKSISVEKQIIFAQRVSISRVFHKFQLGILHYIFVTPSHVILIEERLDFPQVNELDISCKPQFQICALVDVHTNIKQIHLKDMDYDIDYSVCNSACSAENLALLQSSNMLNILYKCGSWLIIEFESNVLLYLNFFTLKQRNEFLDAFLGARSQR